MNLIPKGEVIRHKAILESKEFLQREGIDFDEVFTLVVRIQIIRLVIGLTNMKNWYICQMDVKWEFMNDPLDEEVYVTQPVDKCMDSNKLQEVVIRR